MRDLGLANVRFGAKSSRSVTTEPCPLYPRKRTKSRHVGTSALCQKRTYAVQQNLLMMFQRRLSCVGRLAATASFGASTILGSRIVKVEPTRLTSRFMLATKVIYFELRSSEHAVCLL